MDGIWSFQFYCDACRDGFVASLGQEQPDGTIRLTAFLSRVPFPNERSWIILGLEAGAIAWAAKRLRMNSFSISSRICTDHQDLELLDKFGDYHPRV